MQPTYLAQPWIHSARFDLALIIAPALLISLLVWLLQPYWSSLATMPDWWWLVLIVFVDVSHVYSTLFRTYFDRQELVQRPTLYLLTPLLAWLFGYWFYSISPELFWRVLAYLAVFHFVRQQYGFMMIYGRGEPAFYKWLDKVAIYSATIYPLIYWHCHQRNFNWFVAGDFVVLPLWLDTLAFVIYLLVLGGYLLKECYLWRAGHRFNWPRNLMLLATVISWYVGIVALNHDLAFSAINVIAHGIPYMALIWIYGHHQAVQQTTLSSNTWRWPWLRYVFQARFTPLFVLFLCVLAYAEEWLWDGLIWLEHGSLMIFNRHLPVLDDPMLIAAVVALLATPQITHYVLDAFIWRLHTPNTNWKTILFNR